MVDSLHGLRHNTVIGSYYQDRNICGIGTTHTHGSKCLMARRIQKRDLLVIDGDHISTDVLCDTACFPVSHVGISDAVQKRCLTVVNMTHNTDYRRSCNQ